MSLSLSEYPRGRSGKLLVPGTPVKVAGLKSKKQQHLNNQEGVVETYDQKKERLHVRMTDGSLKGLHARNLQKVLVQEEAAEKEEDDAAKACEIVKRIFRMHDVNGDGIISRKELSGIMLYLGIDAGHLNRILEDMDDNRDGYIQYDELQDWWMDKGARKAVQTPYEPADAGHVSSDDEEEDGDGEEVTLDMIKELGHGRLPSGWPDHGLKVANNMKARFPDYPLEGILWKMKSCKYHGGDTMEAIRKTGAKEISGMPPAARKLTRGGFDAFPSMYTIRPNDLPLKVYEEGCARWSLDNMRNGHLHPVGRLTQRDEFEVKEVVYCNASGIAFGRIAWDSGVRHDNAKYWVDLGLELTTGRDFVGHYTNAERLKEIRI